MYPIFVGGNNPIKYLENLKNLVDIKICDEPKGNYYTPIMSKEDLFLIQRQIEDYKNFSKNRILNRFKKLNHLLEDKQ